MVQDFRPYPVKRVINEHPSLDYPACTLFSPESIPTAKTAGSLFLTHNLRRFQVEIILVILHQIPGVTAQPVFNVTDKARWTEKPDRSVPPQTNPDQMIKTDKMIHVGVGNIDLPDLEQIARR